MHPRTRLSLMLLTALMPAAAIAQSAQPFTASDAYKACSGLVSADASRALQQSEEWLKIDDSVAAHHCRAMALYGLGRYAEAGAALDTVRVKIDPATIALRSYVAQQAARAWSQAGKPENALRVLTEQTNELTMTKSTNLTESKLATELLLDRSRIRITHGQLAEAVQDLDQAISLSPGSEDVLMQRAKIFAQLGDIALAQQDLQVILRMNPRHSEAQALMRVLRDR